MPSYDHYHGRIVASLAATTIALACGTNYVYSAWAPQFAERLKLSSTESNLVGLFGNLGMYTLGVPIGMFVDHRGPSLTVLAGSALLAIGYFPLHTAYRQAAGSVPMLCFFSYLSGLGGCMAFAASVKTSALNWPYHRGSATAFPLAAFGLSALFFSLIGQLLSSGDPGQFLLLLSCGTCGMTFVGFFFLKVYAHPQSPQEYHAVPESDNPSRPRIHRRTSSEEAKRHRLVAHAEPGTSESMAASYSLSSSSPSPPPLFSNDVLDADETSSAVSECFVGEEDPDKTPIVDLNRSYRVDIRGLSLLRNAEFWQLFLIMGNLAGIGLMTINNIGNNAKALWEHYDNSVDNQFLIRRQQVHVSVLSTFSFLGRLSSGVGSDILVKKLNASRVWCLVFACFIFFIAQICALNITVPQWLVVVSALSGLGYGLLFGAFPSIVAETFGINGLSQNWGFMTLAPVLSSNLFNIFYGQTYDRHSVIEESGETVCYEGLACYQAAYWVTFGACMVGVFIVLWVIRCQHAKHMKESRKGYVEN